MIQAILSIVLNLPIAPLAGIMVVTALHLKIPRRPLKQNLQHMDWLYVYYHYTQ